MDACVAAAFASWVVESPLTGPGAGGFMLVHRGSDGSSSVLDFFAAVPGLGGAPRRRAELEAVDIDFESESHQVFRIGAASCAVPGAAAGLEAAHRAYGSLPWRQLVEPAVHLARRGVELTRGQAYMHAVVDVILRHTEEGRRVYGGPGGERLGAGDRLELPDLAATLELIAGRGAGVLYRGALARTVARRVREQGGDLSAADLAAYRVIKRRPVRTGFRGHVVVSNPPPSSGGVLIAYGLSLLDRAGLGGGPGSAGAIARLADVMRDQALAREGRFAADLHRGGLARRLLSEESLRAGLARIARREAGVRETAARGTTHISVVDGLGNAASLTCSTGSGSGVIVPGTGVHLNNMLGEYDLNPGGRARPGTRLTSMMAPSIVLRDGRPRLVVGSAGSVRLRGAIMQVVVNVAGHGLPVGEAIERPRVHVDEPHVHCEGGADPAELDRVEARGYDVVRWRRRNLYFGGAAGVELRPDGTLAAAGDPRRGGHGVVVR